MIDLNILEHMKTLTGSNTTFSKDNVSQKDFYSILIKHQLNMIDAWNPKKSDSFTGINSGQLTEAFLKFKDIQKSTILKPSIDTQKVLKSYQKENPAKVSSNVVNNNSLYKIANQVAQKNNVPETLFEKLIQTESAFNPNAKSPRGAMGLGQLMPATAEELGLSLKEDHSSGSILHPESNLNASARYLRKLFDKYVGEGIPSEEAWNFAAGAYNAGMGNIGRAMERVSGKIVKNWDQVAEVLPEVTGKYSSETVKYVNRLRA